MSNKKTKFYDLKDLKSYIDDFEYVYSPLSKTHCKFRQEEKYVSNYRNDEATMYSAAENEAPEFFYGVNPDEYAWIGLLSKERYTEGTVAKLHCYYDKFGVPMIMFADKCNKDEKGNNILDLYHEVVAWEEGCNIWEIKPSQNKAEWNIAPTLLAEPKFPIADKEPVEIIVKFGNKEIIATVNGHKYNLKIENMPESYHIGFAICEGIGHFYDFIIETK